MSGPIAALLYLPRLLVSAVLGAAVAEDWLSVVALYTLLKWAMGFTLFDHKLLDRGAVFTLSVVLTHTSWRQIRYAAYAAAYAAGACACGAIVVLVVAAAHKGLLAVKGQMLRRQHAKAEVARKVIMMERVASKALAERAGLEALIINAYEAAAKAHEGLQAAHESLHPMATQAQRGAWADQRAVIAAGAETARTISGVLKADREAAEREEAERARREAARECAAMERNVLREAAAQAQQEAQARAQLEAAAKAQQVAQARAQLEAAAKKQQEAVTATVGRGGEETEVVEMRSRSWAEKDAELRTQVTVLGKVFTK